MTDMVALIPVRNRPQNVAPLVESFYSSLSLVSGELMFIVNNDDEAQLAAIERAGEELIMLPHGREPGDYARKMNAGCRLTRHSWVFLGADDLRFQPGWADVAVSCALSNGKRVVGTNDLGNPSVVRGRHSTHTLVHRSYLERGSIDDPDVLLHEGYDHNWVDEEFIRTAQFRGEFVASGAVVEHLHPSWGKAQEDDTYRVGNAGFTSDRRLFQQRSALWGSQVYRGRAKGAR